MLKFSVFFNIVVCDDYYKFPKLRLGVSVLTILYNLFISELLDDFTFSPSRNWACLFFNHPLTTYLSPNFLKEMLKRNFFEKSDFFELVVNKCYFKQISPLSFLINVKVILFIQKLFCRFEIYSYLCSKI